MLVAYCQLWRHCRNLAEGGCLLSRFHFTRCRYLLSHVVCQNLPWHGLTKDRASERKMEHKERPTIAVQFPTNYRFHIPCNLKSKCQPCVIIHRRAELYRGKVDILWTCLPVLYNFFINFHFSLILNNSLSIPSVLIFIPYSGYLTCFQGNIMLMLEQNCLMSFWWYVTRLLYFS